MCMLVKPQADQAGGILRTVDITPKTAAWHFTFECDLYYLNVIADPHRVGNYQLDPAFHRQLPLPPSDKITGSIVCPSAKAK